MASITIPYSLKNWKFAEAVCEQAGANMVEDKGWIIIESSPMLKISRKIFERFYNKEAGLSSYKCNQAWQSLLLRKSGYYHEFNSRIIILGDEPLSPVATPGRLLYVNAGTVPAE